MITSSVLKRLNIGYTAINPDTYQNLLNYEYNGRTFYLRISDTFHDMMRKVFQPLGCWKQNPHKKSTTIQMGVVYFDGRWGRENTWDTNRSGQCYLFIHCNKFLEKLRKNGYKTYDLGGGRLISTDKIYIDDNWELDIELTYKKLQSLLWIIDYNSSEWFIRGNEVCDETNDICRQQMIKGDTAERIFQLYDHIFFDGYEKEYSTGLGDPRDMIEGTDLWLIRDGVEKRAQIKFDRYQIINEEIITTGNFSKKSRCDYFIIVSPESIILLKNNYNGYRVKHKWYFPKTNLIKEIKIFNMFEYLKEIITIVEKEGLTLQITKEDTNNSVVYDYETKTIKINFSDDEDGNIVNMVKEELENLKKRFN